MLLYFWPSDDEQLAGQWTDSHFDEDGSWWNGLQQCGAVFALATALALGASSTQAAQGVFSQSQDDPAGSLSTQALVTEEYWQNPVPPVNWPQPSVFTDDDVHPTFVQTFTPDDGDYWHQLVPPVPATNYVALPFLDPEEIPVGSFPAATNPVDDSSIWVPNSPPWEPTWTLLFFLDDGSAVPVFQYDEDFWPASAQPLPVNWPQPQQPFAVADETVPEFVAEDVVWLQPVPPDPGSLTWPQPWIFEQNETPVLTAFTTDEYWLSLVAPVPDSIWLLRQDVFEQTDATGGLTSGLEEGVNPTLVAPVQASLLPLWPFLFDQVETPTFVPFTDEIFWANPVPPAADTLWVLRQDAFDQQEPSGSLFLDLDEGLWLNPVFPDPGGLALLQQWPFEQNEPAGSLYVIPNEEYWQNPVPPVVWPQPSVFVFDESIQQFVNTFQPDEDLWQQLTPPVQAANFLAPFVGLGASRQAEEETPVLSTPIPPPVVPCVPPVGFDADTAVSYFGGKTPTAVLLCRICNSGKPLLVRGDYAIWCQDCCAFVSKQDTVMGTVRAPSQFKAIF